MTSEDAPPPRLDPQELLRFKELKIHLASHPEDEDSWIEMAVILFARLNEVDGAIRVLKDVLERDPSHAKALFWLARIHYRHGLDLLEAKELLQRSLKASPDRPESLSQLAMVRSELGDPPEELVPLVEKALKAAPDWVTPRVFLARLLLSLGRLEDAEIEAVKSVSYVGRFREPQGTLARYFESAITGRTYGDNEEDIAELMSAIRQEMLSRG